MTKTAVSFTLPDEFVATYASQTPPFGFNGLGELVYLRTYSRIKEDGNQERWHETVRRVVEGTYTMHKRWITEHNLGWSERKAQRSAQEMYDRMFNMKFLPPGRGLWAMGSTLTNDREMFAALSNCAFVSTENLDKDLTDPFTFLMDASMLGIGVGFDTKGAGKLVINKPLDEVVTYVIPDTREGWVESLKLLLESYFIPLSSTKHFDYSQIRPEGTPIKGFGGVASGPGPLVDLHVDLRRVLDSSVGQPISVTNIVDIQNLIGRTVVAGNVRRTAEIAFGDPHSQEFLDLKNYEVNPHRAAYGWTSNNSIFAEIGMDYAEAAKRVKYNGEPGFAWLDNMRAYSRMVDAPDYKDARVGGGNPCLEQSLESYELCCVTGDTRIHTKSGVFKIRDVVGQPVEVWNGHEWSEVTPYLAGVDKKIYRVTFSDGSYLDATDNHRWLTKRARTFKEVTTLDLRPGDLMPSFSVGEIIGESVAAAYEYGFFAGDGYMDKQTPMLALYGNDKQILSSVKGRVYTEETPAGYSVTRQRVNLSGVLDNTAAVEFKVVDNLPDNVFTWDKSSTLEFLAGYIDADGAIANSGTAAEGLRIFGSEGRMRDIQLLLRRVGINHASVYLLKGQKKDLIINGRATSRTYPTWVCQIPSFECGSIPTRVKRPTNIGSRFCINNAHPAGAKIDRARKQRVVSVDFVDVQDSYCFTEPKRGMGVFGNVLTFQCLVETFPENHTDMEDYLRTLKFAYLYAKTVTLGKTPWARTNRVLLRNRRIGLSMSGIQQAISKLGIEEFREWCEQGYETVRYYDDLYSEWLAIPKSVKVTSVKPSGSVSLLAGATPGMHWPESKTYIRRMRLGKHSDLIEPLRAAGYHLEPAVGSEDTTLVVEIPVKIEEDIRTVSQVSMWEQLSMAAFLQRYWSDNQVSATITFDPETEGDQIAAALNYFQYQLKGISFLPRLEAGAYAQMPYEAISEERYQELVGALKPLQFGATHEKAESEKFCDGDSCVI